MRKIKKVLMSMLFVFAMVLTVMPVQEVSAIDNGFDPEAELQKAINAGGDVKLGENVTVKNGITVPVGVTVTLDLAGKTITLNDSDGTETNALITNNGTLTIMDSGTNGKLIYNSVSTSTDYSTSTIINNGVLKIESGAVENTSSGGASYAIDNYNTLNMIDGTVVAKKVSIRQAQFGNYDNIVNISDGVIGGKDSSGGLQIHGFSNSKKTSTTITGGTFNGSYAFYSYFHELTNTSNTNINVSNATFNGYVYLYNHNAGGNEYPFKAEITSGTYNSGVWVYTYDSESNEVPSKVVSGGNFPDGLDEAYISDGFVLEDNKVVDPNAPTPTKEPAKSTVEFVVDGKVWRTYRVTKGADINMPEVPEKEGYVGEWDHDGENIRTTTTITAKYTKVEEPVNNNDLSDYANFQLPVYANSRVTNIATANGSITVDGYMFKANADCNAENSIWREIIFVNEEDYSMAKAYRKQVTPVYNTWLNKNMTATGNGTYALDYANYTVTFSNTDINNYVGNTPATKMATGSYLAYMRISDGANSYLFPLKDIVLSDGSTLALPNGFEVVDTTTRALRYIVK